MCTECGCGLPPQEHDPNEHEHIDEHGNRYTHSHDHDHAQGRKTDLIAVHKSIMSANDLKAERNRGFFQGIEVLAVNVLSSPGSGKTTLLKRLIEKLAGRKKCGVIVGDLETDNDARRLRETGAPVVQVSTGTLCHLDADMVSRALSELAVRDLDILFIENVGNLVCPATFDLGESSRLAMLSVTEGEDKPLKYPPLFRFADSIVISKIDLAEACEFDRDLAIENIRAINPKAPLFEVSAKTGEGIESLLAHLLKGLTRQKQPSQPLPGL